MSDLFREFGYLTFDCRSITILIIFMLIASVLIALGKD